MHLHSHHSLAMQPQQPSSYLPPSYSTPPPPPARKGNNNNRRGQQQRYQQSFQHDARGGGSMPSTTTNNPLSMFHQQYQQSTHAGAAAASALTATLLNQHQGPRPPNTSAQGSGGNVPWYSSYQPLTTDQRLAVSRAMAGGIHGGGGGGSGIGTGAIVGSVGPPASGMPNPTLSDMPNLHQQSHPQQRSWNNQHHHHTNNTHPYRHSPNHRNQRGRGRGGGGSGRGGSKAFGSRAQHQNKGEEKLAVGEAAKTEGTAPEVATVTVGLHCSACNITFNNEPALKTHLAAHVKCPDCTFTASPGHVSNHRKTAHSASGKPGPAESVPAATATTTKVDMSAMNHGEEDEEPQDEESEDEEKAYLLKKATQEATTPKPSSKFGIATPSLAKYERHPLTPTFKTEEDIKNWIAERRKHWPTATNIQRKEEERQEMVAKGQLPPGNTRGGKRLQAKQQQKQGAKRPNDAQVDSGKDVDMARHKKAKVEDGDSNTRPGTGLVAYASSSSSGDEQSEAEGEEKKTQEQGHNQVKDAEQDESDNEDMDPVRDAVTSKDPTSMGKILLPDDRSAKKRQCKYFARGKCTKGDRCTFLHDPSLAKKAPTPSNKKETFRNRKSLLEMLLSSEINDEKNKILEALRYIVENDFFDKAEPTGPLVQEVHPVAP